VTGAGSASGPAPTGQPTTRTLTASLRSAGLDMRRGVVRLHPQLLADLGLREGDPVRLTGRRSSAALVAPTETSASPYLLYADDLTLGNLGLRDGGSVSVEPVPTIAAERVTVSGPPEIVAVVSPELLRLALLGKAVSAGDNVSLLPPVKLPDPRARAAVTEARRRLANLVGYAWTATVLVVEESAPDGIVVVTEQTVVGWEHGPTT